MPIESLDKPVAPSCNDISLGEYLLLAERHKHLHQVVVMFKGVFQLSEGDPVLTHKLDRITRLPVVEDTGLGGARKVEHFFPLWDISTLNPNAHENLAAVGMEIVRTLPLEAVACLAPAWIEVKQELTIGDAKLVPAHMSTWDGEQRQEKGYLFQFVVFVV